MKKAVIVSVAGLMLAGGTLAPLALGAKQSKAKGSGPKVTVSVKSLSSTLLKPTAAYGEKGSITKGGTPSGKCPGKTAAGALDAATHGNWTGKYYASVSGIFITSILGVKPAGKDYWGFYVDGKSSSQGICAVKLTAGEKLLFKIIK